MTSSRHTPKATKHWPHPVTTTAVLPPEHVLLFTQTPLPICFVHRAHAPAPAQQSRRRSFGGGEGRKAFSPGMGGAVAAGMGGGGGRARSNGADDPTSSDVARVKDLDKFGRAREAERLAAEAMARVRFSCEPFGSTLRNQCRTLFLPLFGFSAVEPRARRRRFRRGKGDQSVFLHRCLVVALALALFVFVERTCRNPCWSSSSSNRRRRDCRLSARQGGHHRNAAHFTHTALLR